VPHTIVITGTSSGFGTSDRILAAITLDIDDITTA
jgi:trans-2-enoyl-CoA reductase